MAQQSKLLLLIVSTNLPSDDNGVEMSVRQRDQKHEVGRIRKKQWSIIGQKLQCEPNNTGWLWSSMVKSDETEALFDQ